MQKLTAYIYLIALDHGIRIKGAWKASTPCGLSSLHAMLTPGFGH